MVCLSDGEAKSSCMMTHRYPIEIHGIYIAPRHRVFGRGEEDLSGEDLESKVTAKLIANAGIEGDRFCRPRPEYNGHVTFFSKEVWDDVSETLDLPDAMGSEIVRRNIVISGVDLKALYGVSFMIQNIQFMGTVHCAPCLAMNRALGARAREAMRSRGGLRAQVKTSGILKTGSSDLWTEVAFDPENAASQAPLPRIP